MNIIISGRHTSVSDAMRKYVEEKLEGVLDVKNIKISSARVVLDIEKSRNAAEIIVNVKHHNIETKVEAYDMYEAIDIAVDKIEKQLRRYIDKVQDHHRGLSAKGDMDLNFDGDEAGDSDNEE